MCALAGPVVLLQTVAKAARIPETIVFRIRDRQLSVKKYDSREKATAYSSIHSS